ncbi:4967_t:CDS:2, partial [Ambispora leptoticha]
PGGKLLKNYGKIEVLFQVDDYAEYIKISIIEGNQPYMLLSEADKARFKISKDREGRIATINEKPINYQDVEEYYQIPKEIPPQNEKKPLNSVQRGIKEQETLLKEQVKRNNQRHKLIGTTCDEKWNEIVKTALATYSNILQIFLTYQEINRQFKNEQEKRYTMLQNGEPDMTEDNNIIIGNKAIGLKMVLHITLGLYINGPLW